MITEEQQDTAVEYVFGMLDAAAARAFEAEMNANEELRGFVTELRESAAAMAHDASPCLPPPELRGRILAVVQGEVAVAGAVAQASAPLASHSAPSSRGNSQFSLIPWAIAAGLAVTSTALWMERDQWRSEALAVRSEALELRQRDAFSRMKIAMLTAQNEAFAKAGAVVVWDESKQRGMVKLINFPAAGAGKDYQLWVVDPKYPQPVSGGVLPVRADGVALVSFAPDQPIKKADKFAISIEKEGGVPQSEGPKVFVGD